MTRTIYIWPGVRVFGYGATRPVFVLADNTPGFQTGEGVMVMFTGWRFSDNLDTYGFVSARPGHRIYVSSESEDVTYSALVGADGTLRDLPPFAQRGGESVAVYTNGRVYVANGQIFVYNPEGKQIAQIDVPERPIDIVFGGPEHQTLFILSRHALFAVSVRGLR